MLHKIILEYSEIFSKYNECSPTDTNNWEPYKFGGDKAHFSVTHTISMSSVGLPQSWERGQE